MKKLFVSAGVISAMLLTSCGGGADVCSCMKTGTEMAEAMVKTEGDAEKMTAVTAEYADAIKACEALSEGKTDEEMKAMAEEAAQCK